MIASRVRSLLRNLFRRGAADQRLDTELAGYVELLAAEHRAAGMPAREAWRRAVVEVGGNSQVKEAVWDIRAGAAIERLFRDVRLAARGLVRAPVFTLSTVAALALGLGATVVVLAIADAVVIRALPYRDAGQLVTVLQNGTAPISPANYLDYKAEARDLLRLEAAEYWTPTLTDGDPEKVDGLHVSPGMMEMLGVPPARGAGFTSNGEGARELLISDALWRRRYGGDPDIVGRTVRIGTEPYVVVGVMPPGFQFAPFWATRAQVWAPLSLAGLTGDRNRSSLRLFGRLAPGTDLAQARARMDLVTSRLAVSFPESNKDIRVIPLKEKAIGNTRPALYALCGAVVFVLLITWVNVAHMLIARASSRERELGLRVALGASRARVMRESLIESTLLAGAGGLLALGLAAAALELVATYGPFDLPQIATLRLDLRVGSIAALLIAATSLVVAILPASFANAAASRPTLRHDARGATSGAARTRLRQVLIASEMAFAVVLLIGTSLMVRTFASMRAIDPGFEAAGLITMQVPVPGSMTSGSERLNYFDGMIQRLRALPGVSGAGFVNHLPLAGDEWRVPVFGGLTEGAPEGGGVRSVYRVITPGLLEAMRIDVDQGRDILATDDLERDPVVIVNRRLARQLWPGGDAVGQRLAFAPAGGGARSWRTVVGVVDDVKQSQWTAQADEEVYLPYAQTRSYLEGTGRATSYLTLVVRSTSDQAGVVATARRLATDADRMRPVTDVATMTDVVGAATARPRFLMSVLLGFGALAVILAAVGIYGVMTYSVAQRRQEIGIRMALGATGRMISAGVLGQAAVVTGVGISIGAVAALGLTRLVTGQLYGVTPRDPVSFVVAAGILGATALLATLGPVRKAVTIDPLRAIRSD